MKDKKTNFLHQHKANMGINELYPLSNVRDAGILNQKQKSLYKVRRSREPRSFALFLVSVWKISSNIHFG